jgi:hypothetical protein
MEDVNKLILECQTLLEKQREIMREMYRIVNGVEPTLNDEGLIEFV